MNTINLFTAYRKLHLQSRKTALWCLLSRKMMQEKVRLRHISLMYIMLVFKILCISIDRS